MQPYSKKEIRKLSEYEKKHIECNVLPLKKLVKLFDEGWVVYDTQITTDENIKLLTLAKITQLVLQDYRLYPIAKYIRHILCLCLSK